MKKKRRPRPINDNMLRVLWSAPISEAEIAKRMDHSRTTLRKHAVEKLGLPAHRKKEWQDAQASQRSA